MIDKPEKWKKKKKKKLGKVQIKKLRKTWDLCYVTLKVS